MLGWAENTPAFGFSESRGAPESRPHLPDRIGGQRDGRGEAQIVANNVGAGHSECTGRESVPSHHTNNHQERDTMKTLATLLLTTAALTAGANADLVGNYYVLPNNIPGTPRHIDVQSGIDGGIVTGLVQSTLGPNGLPVATNLAMTRVAGSGNIQDLNTNTNEILWWTPGRTGNRTVLFEKTQADSTPFTMLQNFFPDGQTSNAWGFRAVHWSGAFFTTQAAIASLTMSVQADDDAWVFINNTLAVDNGGVKAIGRVSNLLGTGMVVAGWNTIEIFFADRNQVQSGIGFRSNATFIPTPGAAALIGLAGLCASRRRRA